MKKKIMFLLPSAFIVIILGTIVWWNSLSAISSGVYIEKQTGTVVLETESRFVEFTIPIIWVKANPWEEPPVLEDLKLIDKDGDVIANIEGKYPLKITDNKWNDRVLDTEIRFYLNGDVEMDEWGYSTKPLTNNYKESYYPYKLRYKMNGEIKQYLLEDTYQFIPIDQTLVRMGMEGFSYLHEIADNGMLGEKKGYIVELNLRSDYILKDILFWMPGMPDDYINNHVLYSYEGDLDTYLDVDEFEGKTLSLPLGIERNHVLVYLPLTPEMEEKMKNSNTYLKPYFKFRDDSGEEFYIGGMGSIGPFDRDTDWSERLIMPEN